MALSTDNIFGKHQLQQMTTSINFDSAQPREKKEG